MRHRKLRREALAGIALALLGLLLIGSMVFAVAHVFTAAPPVDTGGPVVPFGAADPVVTPSGALTRQTEQENISYNFLCLGTDVATGLSDTILLVHLGPAGDLTAMQLPRDTYIRDGERECKLNAYVLSKGPAAAAKGLEEALCIRIDYTVTVDTAAFAAAVDAVGGVKTVIPFDMDYDDPYQNLHIHLKQGEQVLYGEEAVQFVRYRSGYANGDLGRLDAQKTFLLALLRTVREKLDLSALTGIVTEVFPRVTTDMPLQDCLYFAGRVLGSHNGAKGLTLLTAPGKALWTQKTGTSYYVLGREALLSAVNTHFNVFAGEIPDALFDAGHAFCKDGDEDFERIYIYAIVKTETVTGE